MYYVIDIETANADQKAMEIEKQFAKIGNLKDPVKIQKKRDSLKPGVLDLSPLFCIGAKSPLETIIFSWASLTPEEQTLFALLNIRLVLAKDEKNLMLKFGGWLMSVSIDTQLISSSGRKSAFDLKKIRMAFIRHNLPVPEQLFRCKHFDLASKFDDFSVQNTGFYKVEEICFKLGIPFRKTIPGDMIGKLIAQGHHAIVLLYNNNDLFVEELIALRLLKGVL